jgi:formate hydrogenlyase transcriptional activator
MRKKPRPCSSSSRAHDRLHLLLEVNSGVVAHLELRPLFQDIAVTLRRVMPCDYVGVALSDVASQQLRLYALDFPAGQGFLQEDMRLPMAGSASGKVFQTGKPLALSGPTWLDSEIYRVGAVAGIQSGCFLPLLGRQRVLGVLQLARLQEQAFTQDDVDFLSQVAIAVDNALEYRQVTEARARLAEETRYLQDELRTTHNFDEIIGSSAALQRVLRQVEVVAPTDATLLIRLPPAEWQRSRSAPDTTSSSGTLEEVERGHILQVLRDTKGVIGGPQGAAARLGLRRTTLLYRLEKLGIPRRPA